MTRVLVADNHRLFRTGLVALLRQSLGRAAIIVEAGSFKAAIAEFADAARFDAILLDLDMLGPGAGQELDDLLAAAAGVPVCVVTRSGRGAEVTAFRSVDTHAQVHVVESFEHLIRVLQTATASTHNGEWEDDANAAVPGTDRMAPNAELTPTETQVLLGICQGCSNKEIARRHGVSLNAIKIHARNIFAKLGVDNRTQAAMMGVNRYHPDGQRTKLTTKESLAVGIRLTDTVRGSL